MVSGELFDGHTFDEKADKDRLSRQLELVRAAMLDGAWRTLEEIERLTGAPPASVSARLRDLRKPKFGSGKVDRRARGPRSEGLFEYRWLAGEQLPEAPVGKKAFIVLASPSTATLTEFVSWLRPLYKAEVEAGRVPAATVLEVCKWLAVEAAKKR